MPELSQTGLQLPEGGRGSYANLGRRLTAYLIDVTINISVVIVVGLTLRLLMAVGVWMPGGVPGGTKVPPEELWGALGVPSKLLVLFAFFISTGPVYFMFFEASPWQATLGKRLVDIYVASDDGKRVSVARAFGRNIAKWFLNSYVLFLISVITIAVTNKRKGLHDFAAHTLVLRGRPAPRGSIEPWRIAVSFGFPLVWILATFLVVL
jgi:uncharacterized RDD family membrane protein YckC